VKATRQPGNLATWQLGNLLSDLATQQPSNSATQQPKKGGTMRKLTLAITAWIVAITSAHFALNVNWNVLMNDRLPEANRKLNVAYIPVT
jgi:hypothetical protein